MTPPVVGPGVVAFGTVSTPAYAMPGLGLTTGGQINTQPEPRVVTFTYQNTEVLAALQKLRARTSLRRRSLATLDEPKL